MTASANSLPKWPKRPRNLTPKQDRIAEDLMVLWQEILPRRHGLLERFNHGYLVCQRRNLPKPIRTLEIGAGLGEHLRYKDISDQDYYANELRPETAQRIIKLFPGMKVGIGDCQDRLPFEDNFLDRIIAIHVLEHLRNLPAAFAEIRRMIKPTGQFCIFIPCEGGLAYSFARDVSTSRIFEKRSKMPYDWWIQSECVNMPNEILEELELFFEIVDRVFFPLHVPIITLNLVIGLTLRPRANDSL